jgi:stage V sporulation protein AE
MKFLFSFLVGGGFCLVAQLLIDLTRLTPARILVLYVTSGVLLGAIGLFDPLKEFAGAGATVPLVGFGGTIADGVKQAVEKDGFLGVFSGPLSAAAAGTTAALCFGYLAALLFHAKPKIQ